MNKVALSLMILSALAALPANADTDADVAQQLVALERKAMDGWLKGDPEPLLTTLDPNVTYIHAAAEKRLVGVDAVRELCDRYRGRPLFDSYEIVEPKVQRSGGVAVLTYELISNSGAGAARWKATVVYQQKAEGWRVIHTHWSAPPAR